MLIARINHVLQVTYVRGGQLQYSGHNIFFPQDIYAIATHIPRTINGLDMLIVNRKNIKDQEYIFYVCRSNVYEALKFKIEFDPYYKEVQLDKDALSELLETSLDISNLLYTTIINAKSFEINSMETNTDHDESLEITSTT